MQASRNECLHAFAVGGITPVDVTKKDFLVRRTAFVRLLHANAAQFNHEVISVVPHSLFESLAIGFRCGGKYRLVVRRDMFLA